MKDKLVSESMVQFFWIWKTCFEARNSRSCSGLSSNS